MRLNQERLRELGVSHPALEWICRESATKGLTTKLTGAGGGGCSITVLPSEASEDAVQSAASLVGRLTAMTHDSLPFECFETVMGGAGVRCATLDAD